MSEQPTQEAAPEQQARPQPPQPYTPPFVEDVEPGPEPDPPPPPFTWDGHAEPPHEIVEPVMPFTGEEAG